MPWVPAPSPHGPVTSARALTVRVAAVPAVAAAAGILAACGSKASSSTTPVDKPGLTMVTGTFPLSVTVVALGRVGDLMQEQHAVPSSVNVAALAREMTAR